MESSNGDRMKRVVVDHFGGPEVLKVVEEDAPRPALGEVRVRVLAAGVSFTDAQLRAGTYIAGAPKPPFTPGYELVGVVEELGPNCSRLRVGAGGVDVVLDSLGGPISFRSFRALRPGGRLVVFGRYSTLSHGHKDWRAVFEWWAAILAVWAWDKLSPRRKVLAYHVQRYRDRAARRAGAVGGEPSDPDLFREDSATLIELLREGKIHPVVAQRLPLAEARHAHELLESTASKGKLV